MRKQIKVWDAEDKTAHAAPAQMGFLSGLFKKMDRCCLQTLLRFKLSINGNILQIGL